METVLTEWNENSDKRNKSIKLVIEENKMIFVESRQIKESLKSLEYFKQAISCGRGAIFLACTAGPLPEIYHFSHSLCRCAVFLGGRDHLQVEPNSPFSVEKKKIY